MHDAGCGILVERKHGLDHMQCTFLGCNTYVYQIKPLTLLTQISHFCDSCGKMIIKGVSTMDIEDAVTNHYKDSCNLFETIVT
jgi:hypothetical protein